LKGVRSGRAPITSGLPRKADNFRVGRHVSKVPNADVAGHFTCAMSGIVQLLSKSAFSGP
jgi:hypothetical protein